MKIILTILSIYLSTVSVFTQTCVPSHRYWFNSNVNDDIGNAHGVLMGGATANGSLAIGYNTNSYLVLPSSTLNGLTDFSFTFNIKFFDFNTTGGDPTNHILSGANNSNYQAFAFAYQKDIESLALAINGDVYHFPTVCEVNTWYCFSISRAGNQIKFFVNGIQAGSTQTVNTTPINISQNALIIGQEQDCIGGCFALNQCMNGLMDNLKISDCANTESVRCNDMLDMDEPEVSSLSVYPNPANDFLILELNGTTQLDYIQIIDMTGKMHSVKTSKQTDNIYKINTSELATGIYYITVHSINAQASTQKILISR